VFVGVWSSVVAWRCGVLSGVVGCGSVFGGVPSLLLLMLSTSWVSMVFLRLGVWLLLWWLVLIVRWVMLSSLPPGVGMLLVDVQAFNDLIEPARDSLSKKEWTSACFNEAKARMECGIWNARIYAPRKFTQVESVPARQPVDSAHPVSLPKNPKTVIGPQRLKHEQHANRIEEEARCRQWLVELPWATHIADTEDNHRQSKEMNTLVRSYLQNHDTESCKRQDAGLWPTNMRLWLAEFVWCMDELHKRGKLPRIITHPNDTKLRDTAGLAAGPAGEDPGNVNWDTLVCLCRLWKYVDEGPFREKMHRIDTAAYGQGARSKSSVGACNFRGNVMESLQYTLQQQALGQGYPANRWSRQKDWSRSWWW
jgi:hypothetical protein